MDAPAHSGEADAAHPTFYGLFPRLGRAADPDEEREGDTDLPFARESEPRLRIVA